MDSIPNILTVWLKVEPQDGAKITLWVILFTININIAVIGSVLRKIFPPPIQSSGSIVPRKMESAMDWRKINRNGCDTAPKVIGTTDM